MKEKFHFEAIEEDIAELEAGRASEVYSREARSRGGVGASCEGN